MARNPVLYALVAGAIPLLVVALLLGASLVLALVLAVLWGAAIIVIMTKVAPALQRLGSRREPD